MAVVLLAVMFCGSGVGGSDVLGAVVLVTVMFCGSGVGDSDVL